MLLAVANEFTLQPTVNRSVVELNIVVEVRLEFIGVKDLDGSLLPSGANRPTLSHVDLYMYHSVGERFQFGVGVGSTVENEISRFEVLLCESLVRQQVKLIALVPFSKSVPKFLPQVEDALPNQSATVDEERRRIERISCLMKLLSIRHPNVLVGSLNKFLSKLAFEFLGCSIDLDVFEILVELELVELFFLELFEGFLDGDLGSLVEQLRVFFICLTLHQTVQNSFHRKRQMIKWIIFCKVWAFQSMGAILIFFPSIPQPCQPHPPSSRSPPTCCCCCQQHHLSQAPILWPPNVAQASSPSCPSPSSPSSFPSSPSSPSPSSPSPSS